MNNPIRRSKINLSKTEYLREEEHEYNKGFLRKEFDEEVSEASEELIYIVFSWCSLIAIPISPIGVVVGLSVYTGDQLLPKVLHVLATVTCILSWLLLIIAGIFYFVERGTEKQTSEKWLKISGCSFLISAFLGICLIFYFFCFIREALGVS